MHLNELIVVTMCAAALLLSGCLGKHFVSAPPPSYDVEADLKTLAAHFEPASAIERFYANPSAEERNRVIIGRVTMIDLNYLQWQRTATTDKQFLDSGNDILIMSLNLAATATGGATAKTVLSAVSAGVAGGKTAIDKHYYYEKTLSALIAVMNARRKEVLLRLLKGMGQSLSEYSFEQGLSDVQEYYQAGTFQGAVMTVQSSAGAKEAEADKAIKMLTLPTPEQRSAENFIGMLLDAFPTNPSTVAEIRSTLANVWPDGERTVFPNRQIQGHPSEVQLLLRRFRQSVPELSEALVSELKKQGIGPASNY